MSAKEDDDETEIGEVIQHVGFLIIMNKDDNDNDPNLRRRRNQM